MSEFKVVLASGAEHLKHGFEKLGFQVFSSASNFDGKRFFPNTDLYVRIAEVEELADQRVLVIQSCTGSSPASREFYTTSDRVQELLLLLDLLKNPVDVETLGHKQYRTKSLTPPSQIEVVLTLQPFALQDKAFSTGEAVSSRCTMRSIAERCEKLWLVEPIANRNISWVEELVERHKYEIISITQEI
ncbi:MAG: hypothetical protein ACFFD9_11170, partial [Candidatus Thorarchaeota archaeon]